MLHRFNPANWHFDLGSLGEALLILALALTAALLLHRALFAMLGRIARLSATPMDEMLFERLRQPIGYSLMAIAITIGAQLDPLIAGLWEPLARFIRPALLGWIAYALVKALTAALEHRLEVSEDPVEVRSRRTRIAILSRTATFAIVVITVGLMLMRIPGVQDIGTTLLASAGLAALAVGAAAQPALKSLIAGLQMALTEPLRLGDLVVVDGHTGRVEEIRMSFVIIRTWDERAVIVPTNRFLEQTFENWSRKNERLTGAVILRLDPASEVAPIREEFLRFLATQDNWDGRTGSLALTEALAESIELRLAMSAATIGQLFELRCAVREHMLAWLGREMPGALIHRRFEADAADNRPKQA